MENLCKNGRDRGTEISLVNSRGSTKERFTFSHERHLMQVTVPPWKTSVTGLEESELFLFAVLSSLVTLVFRFLGRLFFVGLLQRSPLPSATPLFEFTVASREVNQEISYLIERNCKGSEELINNEFARGEQHYQLSTHI